MMITFQKITQQQFYEVESFVLFNQSNTSRQYGIITSCNHDYRLAWQSDLILPVITFINSGVYSVGVDQNFVIVNFNTKQIELTLNLDYNFLKTEVFENNILVITELEIVRIEKLSFKVVERYGLPDIFEYINIFNNKIRIKCMDHEELIIPF